MSKTNITSQITQELKIDLSYIIRIGPKVPLSIKMGSLDIVYYRYCRANQEWQWRNTLFRISK